MVYKKLIGIMQTRDIIVIGASAGGFDALKELIAAIPKDLDVSIFIVWHIPSSGTGVLPEVLNRLKSLYAAHGVDWEPLARGRIYVAPPDKHLVLEKDRVRVTRGPKENGFRPAVDPLFRSAAYNFGSRVIGIVLSGALDDGTAGLWTIKQYGGIAIVQDPLDAQVPSMPENAIREVPVDHIVPVADMPALLKKLTSEKIPTNGLKQASDMERIEKEIRIAIQDDSIQEEIMQFGELTQYTCPECHGVLSSIREGNRIRYRCHTGHAFSADSLLAIVSKDIENSLWNTIRSIEESVILLNHMGDHFAEVNQPHMAAQYFKKANDALKRNKLVRQAVLNHEQLSTDSIREQVQQEDGDPPG
jgi:two-component system chemotaxis response regulator CheB